MLKYVDCTNCVNVVSYELRHKVLHKMEHQTVSLIHLLQIAKSPESFLVPFLTEVPCHVLAFQAFHLHIELGAWNPFHCPCCIGAKGWL